MVGRRIEVLGTVQGVGFRPWVYRLARARRLAGRVRNDARGVTIEAFGAEDDLDAFVRALTTEAPPAARVRAVTARPIAPEGAASFVIEESAAGGERRVSIPPDLATCPACLREVLDPADRRHLYPFTNCTDCGPRFTIARDVPYDRPATTMSGFVLCPECRREYETPGDRRFHAQPNACPACGPRLRLVLPGGMPADGEPLAAAAGALALGLVVAVKGLGGFHLACDATSPVAVARLRLRKHRDEKPLAVMVADLEAAREIAEVGPGEAALLTGVERPIVVLRRRAESKVALEVAPQSPLLGVMLAYSPLHLLLLREAGRPLVMTSGNRADEPMAFRDEDALLRLGAIADLFLLHDREIAARCDDSVARVVAGAPSLLRRSRGYVPRPIPLARPLARPVLAVGGHLKNAFCLGVGDQAYLGPHVGDLDTEEAVRAFPEAVDRLLRFVGVAPEIVAHDLHPDYVTTAYAEGRKEPRIGVQHHHAHVASALAEHGMEGPVIGVAYDGTGFGTDGTAWGGEVLWATAAGFERLATLRPLPLAGGEAAIRQVWRLAAALVEDALGDLSTVEDLPLFAGVAARERGVVRQLLHGRLNAPLAHGAGRYFDAVGSLVLGRPRAAFEGQVALALDAAAARAPHAPYPYAVDRGKRPWEVDLRPMTRSIVEDLRESRAPGAIAASFHETLAAATAEVVLHAARERGPAPVVLTGGCFANDLLAERTRARLADLAVCLHREVPPGDGGLALGQLLVADARTRERR